MSSADSRRLLMMEVDQSLAMADRARHKGDLRQAAQAYARAERALLMLAKGSGDAALKQQRYQQAMRLREQAAALENALGQTAVSTRAEPRPRVGNAGGDESAARFSPEVLPPDTGFHQVGGLEAIKEEIRLRMVLPFEHPDKARRFSIAPGGGLLLYGPPGTGKTLLGRATAGELGAAFFSVRASDIVGKYFGEAEKNVRSLFKAVDGHEKAVLFIDEIDALVPSRSRNRSTVMARLVPQFLTEMDGFKQRDNSLLIIGATNEPWALDPAVLRPGRFDVKVYVGLPDAQARQAIIRHHLADRPLADDVDLAELAEVAEGLSGADISEALHQVARQAFRASLEGGAERLDQTALKQALAQAPGSVSEEQVEKYHRWREAI